MEKCPECDKMIPKDKMKAHMKNHEDEEKLSQSIPKKEEISKSLKGGIEMSEENIVETKAKDEQKVEVKTDYGEQLNLTLKAVIALQEEIKQIKLDKANEKKEAKKIETKEVEIEEVPKSKYNIVQGFGSLRGNSFTLVR